MDIFKNIFVFPSYGKKEAIIKWVVDPEYLEGNFVIQKSTNGITNFKTIGSGRGITEFIDIEFLVPNKLEQTHYRIILQYNKNKYESNPIGIFNKLHRHEFGLVARMLKLEHERMYNCRNGIKAVILKKKAYGEPCPSCNFQNNNSQLVGASVCPTCYGTGITGGFDPAIYTYLEVLNIDKDIQASQEGMGATDKVQAAFQILAYPELRKGDLLINPETDQRYLIEKVTPKLFKGIIPITYQVVGFLLRRNDIRYQIPLLNESA